MTPRIYGVRDRPGSWVSREQRGLSKVGGEERWPAPPRRHLLLARFQTSRLALLRPPPCSFALPPVATTPPPLHSSPLPPVTNFLRPSPSPLSLSFIHPFIKLLLSAKAPLGPGARLGCVEKNKTKTWRILTNPWPGVGSSPTPAHLLSARPRLFDLHPARLSFSGLWPWPVDL